jgi:hypothetical protein
MSDKSTLKLKHPGKPPASGYGPVEGGTVFHPDPEGPEGEMLQRRLVPTRGPVHRFKGKLIAEASSWREGKARWQECRLWETEGGAWIAELMGASDAGSERDITTVTVVTPGATEEERRFAVMDGFEWNTLARSMVREQLGWKLERIVP